MLTGSTILGEMFADLGKPCEIARNLTSAPSAGYHPERTSPAHHSRPARTPPAQHWPSRAPSRARWNPTTTLTSRPPSPEADALLILHVVKPSRKNRPAHVPVLFDQVLAALAPRPGQTIVDCTVGLAGHSAAILKRVTSTAPGASNGRLIGLDLDPRNLAAARSVLMGVGGLFDLIHANFAALQTVLSDLKVDGGQVDGLLADVGVASTQIDDPERGFSYRKPGPLDMRMDPARGQPASALVNTMTEADLADAILELGDEEDAPKIARLIVQHRARAPITTTQALMAIVCEARRFTIERAAGAKLHPAARTFQALRILVNHELDNLDRLLAMLPDVLKPGGVAAIISFHSGEDRRVKHSFRDGFRAGLYSEETRDPIIADEDEREANPRARSAKLRWVRRTR